MRAQTTTISLGGQNWPIRPLTVAQVQAIEPLVLAAGKSKTGAISAAVAILRVALSRDHAAAATGLDDIEAAAPDLAAAMARVLRLGGFLPHGDSAPGEVEAGSAPRTDGPAETARIAPSTGAASSAA